LKAGQKIRKLKGYPDDKKEAIYRTIKLLKAHLADQRRNRESV